MISEMKGSLSDHGGQENRYKVVADLKDDILSIRDRWGEGHPWAIRVPLEELIVFLKEVEKVRRL